MKDQFSQSSARVKGYLSNAERNEIPVTFSATELYRPIVERFLNYEEDVEKVVDRMFRFNFTSKIFRKH